ncbi:spermine/spermidine synthase [Mesocricetibacter intestinalis]|uniref:Spermine/spermidine synthase n=1 Tax=Mesocricetibacter intestinalis TaxID=1521930 RepID=A0A4R6V7F6_9PAST|nr:methyltransferase [Mesocricetibacter intestinalis]TDQ56835.1 spermine/spermidine synthase [Mesocricetibacter intestinalis]
MSNKAMLLSFLGGFLSLSIEVIWIRLFSFFTGSLPQAFSFTLAVFLIGIAIGSFIGKRICREGRASIDNIGHIFALSGLLDLVAIGLLLSFVQSRLLIFVLSIFFCALVRGIVFPIVHHLGSEAHKTGAAISNVYFANVMGCTLSPIFIGFYLFDVLTTQQTYLAVIAATFIIAAFCLRHQLVKLSVIIGAAVSVLCLMIPDKLITALSQKPDLVLDSIIENKHGFIQVYKDEQDNKLVFGSNVYDGMLNVDLALNSNMIDRAYLLPVIAPEAKNVLVVGLSTGSWVDVLATMPGLEKITVIELNPAYTQFASRYSEMARILQDKRVHIITDDGRRWIKRNADQKFDFILMNTTFHWRSYSTNLLSKEFLTMAKSRLAENGFLYFNTTSSFDAYYTAKQVFPYVYQYKNMALASLRPIESPTDQNIAAAFQGLRWSEGNPVFASAEALRQGMARMREYSILPYEKIDFSPLSRQPEIITDQNMITEYKYGRFNELGTK